MARSLFRQRGLIAMSVTANTGSYRRFSDWATKGGLRWLSYAALGAIHLAAVVSMALTEADWFGVSVFVLTWGLVNCFWIVLLRRPIAAAAMSLALVELIIVLSTFKYSVLWMSLNFLDVLIIDPDTIAFLLTIYPNLRIGLLIAAVLIVPLVLLIWWLDPFRIRRSVAAACGAGCLAGAIGLSVLVPEEPFDQFQGANHVSIFTRSGVSAVADLMTQGWMEFDTTTTERLRSVASEECRPAKKPPHIIMVLDESSFDIGVVPGVKVPDGYAAHFQSFDGKARKLLVEATGGPTWYTEYNVLTGPVGAFVRTAGLLCDPHRRRARRARPAEVPAALRLQDFHALSGVRRVPQRAKLPGERGRRSTSSIHKR